MAHDYSFSKEVYLNEIKDKIWNWCEITEDDIKDASQQNSLVPFNQNILEEFTKENRKALNDIFTKENMPNETELKKENLS